MMSTSPCAPAPGTRLLFSKSQPWHTMPLRGDWFSGSTSSGPWSATTGSLTFLETATTARSLRVLRSTAEHFSNSHALRTQAGDISSPRVDLRTRSEEHTSELQSHSDLVCRLL